MNMSKVISQFHVERDLEIQRIDEYYSPIHDELLQEAKEAKDTWDKTLQKIQEQKSVPTDEEDALRDAWEKASYRYNASVLEWKFACEAIKKKTRKNIVEFYQEHHDEVKDLVPLVKDEVLKLLLKASMKVDREYLPEEAKRREKVKNIIKDFADDIDVEKEDTQFIYDVTFSNEALRRYIRTSLKEYLDLLEEFAPDSFQETDKYIENCIII